MMRRLLWIALAALLAAGQAVGCGDDEPAQVQQKQAPPPQKTQAEKAPEPTPSADEKAWPYLTGDHKVALSPNPLARNFVLIFDGSGSMADVKCSGNLTKCEAAKKAVLEWSAGVPADANLGLVSFHANSQGLTVLELSAGGREQFIQTVKGISPGGKTPLTNALGQAFTMLELQAQSQLGYGDYTVVIVTDGIANDPKKLSQGVDWVLAKTPINIHTIGFCIGDKHSLNQKGRTWYRAADNPEQLRQGLQEALAESEDFDLADFN